jgi:hypothetical protein
MNDEYLKIPREVHHACQLPDNPDSTVWRYMDYTKFKSLLRESALYLCRVDCLQDRFEGTYSRQQILDMDTWLKSCVPTNWAAKVIDEERQSRIRDKNRTYVSCWCISEFDFDLMWKAYVRNPPGVAVKSTVKRLQQVCDTAIDLWPLDISLVKCIDHAEGELINYPGMPQVFFCKDIHFRLDNELRIVHWPNMGTPTPDHVPLPVSLADMLVSVVLDPRTPNTPTRIKETREALDRLGLGAVPVESSRDERDLVE